MEFSDSSGGGSVPATQLNFIDSVPVGFVRRRDFGRGFLFGSSTSSFQIEGGYEVDGRKPSIFDTFADENDMFKPYGKDAINHRKYYKEDVKLMKEIGFNAYRFSISWTRVMPNGKISREGINFYKDLLMKLTSAGIEPVVTLVHFDPPQCLEDAYYTFLSPNIVDDFCAYADLCFKEFGPYVKYWVTVNEPWFVSYGGYIQGVIPPGFKSDKDYDAIVAAMDKHGWPEDDVPSLCPPLRGSLKSSAPHISKAQRRDGDLPPLEKMPYLAAHHQILAHAKAATLYKNKYQPVQRGKIGLNLVAQWFIPLNDYPGNQEAAQRALDFMFGWFMDPLFKGDYPEVMRQFVTEGHLPYFSPEEKRMVQGSYDYISLNYYTARYVTGVPVFPPSFGGDYVLDRRVLFHEKKNGVPISQVQGAAGWVYGYPKGLLDLLLYIKQNYGDPEICITENGIDDGDDDCRTHWDSFHDQKRILFLHDHLSYIKQAIRRGVKVSGHFVWSFMDNLELGVGYKSRFGVNYVDYEDPKSERIPKFSASWYKYFLSH